jgi:BirA family biotin operon repressor/biotin-[acetyl-CoA-carboxylase] ligase
MSFVLRPGGLPKPEQLTLVSAVAVVEGIKQVAGLVAVIRWPNDVMLAGKKLAGIIAEAQSSSGKLDSVVVGVGVNCNAPVSDPTAKAEATSLGEAVGGPVDITKLRQAILDSLSRHYARLKAGADMLELWKKHVATTGKNVSIKLKTDETPFSCLAEGLDAEGGLMVSSEAGAKFIRAEDLEWLRELP